MIASQVKESINADQVDFRDCEKTDKRGVFMTNLCKKKKKRHSLLKRDYFINENT